MVLYHKTGHRLVTDLEKNEKFLSRPYSPHPHSPSGDCVVIVMDRLSVMLNLVQHLMDSKGYKTLKRA